MKKMLFLFSLIPCHLISMEKSANQIEKANPLVAQLAGEYKTFFTTMLLTTKLKKEKLKKSFKNINELTDNVKSSATLGGEILFDVLQKILDSKKINSIEKVKIETWTLIEKINKGLSYSLCDKDFFYPSLGKYLRFVTKNEWWAKHIKETCMHLFKKEFNIGFSELDRIAYKQLKQKAYDERKESIKRAKEVERITKMNSPSYLGINHHISDSYMWYNDDY